MIYSKTELIMVLKDWGDEGVRAGPKMVPSRFKPTLVASEKGVRAN